MHDSPNKSVAEDPEADKGKQKPPPPKKHYDSGLPPCRNEHCDGTVLLESEKMGTCIVCNDPQTVRIPEHAA